MKRRGWKILAFLGAASLLLLGITTSAGAARHARRGYSRPHGAAARQRAQFRALAASGGAPSPMHTPNDGDLADSAAQYDYERSAPATSVSGAALLSAYQQAQGLTTTGGNWREITTRPYNAEPAGYTDPFWSNVGAGFGLVGGRTTALTQTRDGNWFAGTADGGVWRSSDKGGTWTPVFDGMPSLSIGAEAVNPADGSLWVGTGEANTSQDSYAGTGVYRSTDDGASFSRVGDDSSSEGGNPLVSHTVFQLAFDPAGDAYAATNNGLFRYDHATGTWTAVLQPAGPGDNPPYDQQTTTVAVVPGTGGQDVITAIGWHGPGNTENNGFYESTDGGHTFAKVTPAGIDAGDIGRTTFAYSKDGSKLYAIVQSVSKQAAGDESVLMGIYSASGSPASVAGPWTQVADENKLAASGSALAVNSGYGVGVQAWYNQDLVVDPADPNHLYAGLEEVFQSTNGGTTWNTASPYWNYGLKCNPNCPQTTHPDQHAMMIANNKIVIGNDGGVYHRPLSDAQQYGGWTDTNTTLRSWQYYDGRAGQLTSGGLAVWGGLQDNGTSVLPAGSSQMVEPAGGDGFDVIVDPANANRMVGEYTDGTTYSSTDGGHTFNSQVSPGCVAQATTYPPGTPPRPDCDPSFRFVAPLTQDQQNTNTWVTGGEYVWVSKAGWGTSCTSSSCSWTKEFDTGHGHAVTAVSSANNSGIVYASWVGGGGNPGPAFNRGIVTNYGGTWHQVNTTGLPMRYIAGMTADPRNPAHAYAIFNGYSRRWIPGGGVGHVWETLNGGQSWQDISGNLPDIASDAMVLASGKLALATDQGMFTAQEGRGSGTTWSRLGRGLPNASVDDVTPGPDGRIYAATHGRGIWSIGFGGQGSGHSRKNTTRHRR